MKSKVITVTLFIFFILTSISYSQYLHQDVKINLKKDLIQVPTVKPAESKITLGAGAGFAFYAGGGTGVAVSMFSEMKFDKFSFVPMANFWKIDDRSNFEMAALGRYTFNAQNMKPYVDAGIGLNFYDNKDKESFTKIGLDIGAGVDFPGVIENAIIFIDGKYKVIISNGLERNIETYTFLGGIKFML